MAGSGGVSTGTPLYDQVGGAPAVRALVNRFYDSVLADPHLAPMFAGTDVERLRAHQEAFITVALGGPGAYRGRTVRRAHASHHITDGHFDSVIGHLVRALDDCGVQRGVATEVVERLATLRDDVVQH